MKEAKEKSLAIKDNYDRMNKSKIDIKEFKI